MNYKVGDMVIITARHGRYCASCGLAHIEDMDKFSGEIAVIGDIDYDGDLVLIVSGVDTGFYWAPEWVEPYASCEEDPDFNVDMTSLL